MLGLGILVKLHGMLLVLGLLMVVLRGAEGDSRSLKRPCSPASVETNAA